MAGRAGDQWIGVKPVGGLALCYCQMTPLVATALASLSAIALERATRARNSWWRNTRAHLLFERNLMVYRGDDEFDVQTKPPHEIPELPAGKHLPQLQHTYIRKALSHLSHFSRW